MTQLVQDDDGLFTIEQTIAELESQRQTILAARRADDLAKAKKLIEQHGFTSTELGLKDRQPESREVRKVSHPPKYQHPEKPELQWAGYKGPKPQWVKDWLAEGKTLDELLIKK